MTMWRVTRSWLVKADTGDEAIQSTAGTTTDDVRAVAIGVPTGSAARLIARGLEEREDYWRRTIGDEGWERAIEYWRERFDDPPELCARCGHTKGEHLQGGPCYSGAGMPYGSATPDGHCLGFIQPGS